MCDMKNDVVIYQSADGLVKIEAMIDSSNETIWATQKAMASLLGVDRTVITRHLSNIFKEGELDKEVVCAKIAQTTPHGAMEGEFQTRDVQFYNLDAIISVGYRVNSRKATAFRQWATSVLKQYMLKGYVVNHNAVSEQKYEDLKRALGLLENVFGQNLIMAEQQAKVQKTQAEAAKTTEEAKVVPILAQAKLTAATSNNLDDDNEGQDFANRAKLMELQIKKLDLDNKEKDSIRNLQITQMQQATKLTEVGIKDRTARLKIERDAQGNISSVNKE